MLKPWIESAARLSCEPASLYSGARKIIRRQVVTFTEIEDDLMLADCGFTKNKMRMLEKNYLHEESIAIAQQLWARRVAQNKYGSVGFTCYAHFVKGGSVEAKRSKRASVMGPCIQSVTLTLLNQRRTVVDVFYRTTEFYKKFPADLVFLRDVVLKRFDFSKAPIVEINFYFANVTCHPMYFVTLLPLYDDPIAELERIRKEDEYFWTWIVKWTARYLCDEYARGIMKFSQALRVRQDALNRLGPKKLKKLQKYVRDNHPGIGVRYAKPR